MGTRERRNRSNESDKSISRLFQESGANPDDVAIAAVGGFGRGELSPGSDLDIVFIHKDSYSEESISRLVNQILYPLWDRRFPRSRTRRAPWQTDQLSAIACTIHSEG